jgi:hypothetical protein
VAAPAGATSTTVNAPAPAPAGERTAARVELALSTFVQSKHQSMTARMVHVTNLTPRSDNPRRGRRRRRLEEPLRHCLCQRPSPNQGACVGGGWGGVEVGAFLSNQAAEFMFFFMGKTHKPTLKNTELDSTV